MPVVTVGENTADDFSGCEDTYLDMDNPTDNPDTATTFRVAWYSATLRYNGIIKFAGLSNIDSSSTVNSSTMYLMPHNDGDALEYSARRVLQTVVSDQTTWNIYSTGNNWGTAGGLSDGTDRTGTAEGTDTLTGSVQQYEGMTGLQSIAQNWIDGTYTNNGLHLQSTASAEGDPWRHVISSEGADGSRPYISVDYTASGGGAGNPWYYYAQQGDI